MHCIILSVFRPLPQCFNYNIQHCFFIRLFLFNAFLRYAFKRKEPLRPLFRKRPLEFFFLIPDAPDYSCNTPYIPGFPYKVQDRHCKDS